MPNGVTVMRWIGILTVRPAIGWNDAVWITGNVFVEKDHFIGLLNDSTRRSDPGSARFTTVEDGIIQQRSEEHTSELQSRSDLVCRLLLEKKKQTSSMTPRTNT